MADAKEREARERLEAQVEYWMPESMNREDIADEINEFRTAVRAALVEEIVKRVEGLDTQAHADFKALVLDTIRGVAAGEEG